MFHPVGLILPNVTKDNMEWDFVKVHLVMGSFVAFADWLCAGWSVLLASITCETGDKNKS